MPETPKSDDSSANDYPPPSKSFPFVHETTTQECFPFSPASSEPGVSLQHAVVEDISELEDKDEEEQIVMSTMTLLMVTVIVFSAITGLLMGYDLCIVAVVLEPIQKDFGLCPAQTIQAPSLYTPKSINIQLEEDRQNITRRLLEVPEFTFPSIAESSPLLLSEQFKGHNALRPSPCQMNGVRNGPFSQVRRSLGVTENDEFHSCGPKQMFVAIVSPGAAIGSFLAGFISDWIGRRPTLGLSDFLIMLGTFLMGFGNSFGVLLTGRFILGLGIGTGFVMFSTYVSEISPDHRRGQLVSCQEVAQCVGCLSAYSIVAWFGNEQWRWLFIAAGIIAGLQVVGVSVLPESPRWYVRRHQPLKAENSLRRLASLPIKKSSIEVKTYEMKSLEIAVLDGSAGTVKELRRHESRILKERRIEMKEAAVRRTMWKMTREFEAERRSQLVIGSDTPRLQRDDAIFDGSIEKRIWDRRDSSQTTAERRDSGYPDSLPRSKSTDDVDDSVCAESSCPRNEVTPKNEISSRNEKFPEIPFSLDCVVWGACKRHHRQLVIALGCALCQNLTASTVILYYSTEIYRLAGVDDPFLAGIGIGIAKVR